MKDYDNEWFTLKGSELRAIADRWAEAHRTEFWSLVIETLGHGSDSEVMAEKKRNASQKGAPRL